MWGDVAGGGYGNAVSGCGGWLLCWDPFNHPEDDIETPIPPGLTLTFRLHALIAGLVGAQHLVFPRFWTDLAGMVIHETATWRLIGAALIALAVSSWLASKERVWARVRIVVVLEIVWSVLAAVVVTWGIVAEGLPPLEWLNAGLAAAFALAFGWAYHRAGSGPRPDRYERP